MSEPNKESPFYYKLSPERIAARPASFRGGSRDSSRLLILKRKAGGCHIFEQIFKDLPASLNAGDLLILNNSRVLPYRFFGRRFEKEDEEIEIFLLSKSSSGCAGFPMEVWEAIGRPLKKLKPGRKVTLSPSINGEILSRSENGRRIQLKLYPNEELFSDQDLKRYSLIELILKEGQMPIPPYIRKGHSDEFDRELYQTVFAAEDGSLAAPTAALHFTPELLKEIVAKGVTVAFLTLHIGPASFTLISPDGLEDFEMPKEFYRIPQETKNLILKAKAEGRRIVAVGTTTTRALESWGMADNGDDFIETKLFIKPGYKFKVIDALVTNFHQPGSTHLLMIEALIGRALLEKAYTHALNSGYRFLSYGDAMFIS